MKTKSMLLKLLFLFLFTLILASCSSSPVEEEIALDENENELLETLDSTPIYLIDKETSDRPGNQGGD